MPEQVFQRQISKEGLQKVVDGEKATDSKNQVNLLSSEDLRDLFTLRLETRYSERHEMSKLPGTQHEAAIRHLACTQ